MYTAPVAHSDNSAKCRHLDGDVGGCRRAVVPHTSHVFPAAAVGQFTEGAHERAQERTAMPSPWFLVADAQAAVPGSAAAAAAT